MISFLQRRRSRNIIAGVAVVMLLGGLAMIWWTREPELLGHPTRYWILPWQCRAETPEAIAAAHAAMEARHVRWLRSQLSWSPSRFRRLLDAIAGGLRFSASFQKNDDYREQAAAALARLGARARPAVSKLRAMSETDNGRRPAVRAAAVAALIQLGEVSADPYVAVVQDPQHPNWSFAADVLARIGTNKVRTDLVFAQAMFGSNGPAARARATFLYSHVSPVSPQVVSNLVRALDANETREVALARLRFLGTNAIAAQPAIVRCLTDTNAGVRREATNALRAVTR